MKKGLERDISIEEKEITYYQFFEKDWKDFKAQRLVPNNSKMKFSWFAWSEILDILNQLRTLNYLYFEFFTQKIRVKF